MTFLEIEQATVHFKSRAKNILIAMAITEPHRKTEFLQLQRAIFRIYDVTQSDMIEKLIRNECVVMKELEFATHW